MHWYSYIENSSSSTRCQELIPGNNPTLHNAENRVRSKRGDVWCTGDVTG
jgi:hypothetical protein